MRKLIQEIHALRADRAYVLKKGEIESYLPKGHSDLTKIIELIRRPNWLDHDIEKKARRELDNIVRSLLSIEQ